MNRPKRSLRSILMLWFLLFSIVPLAFVTGYSLVIYEKAINDELLKRLDGNAREIGVIIDELEQYIKVWGLRHSSDPALIFDLATGSVPRTRGVVENWLKNYPANRISLFDREGRLTVSMARNAEGQVKPQSELESGEIFLAEEILASLNASRQISLREINPDTGLEVVVYTKIMSKKGRHAGFIEEIISMDEKFLSDFKKRMKLELLVFNENLDLVAASHPDFSLYPKDFFKEQADKIKSGFFDLTLRDEPHGFRVRTLDGAKHPVYIALGASKKDVKGVLKKINIAMFTVCGLVILLLLPTLLGISRMVLKPMDHLVAAAQKIETGESVQSIPVESNTEIGLLTHSFNQMSKKVSKARHDLENKVRELEATNKELQATQAQLIHTAKMVSLGQLVAGVAHELNNPIGFIYSNMAHLKEYSERLVHLIEVAEKDPKALEKEKEKAEFDYLVQDLPRLIKSCEDGARRTRDIVLGLRNFSRLDEAQIKDMDLSESIKTTLDLLSGELKTRIQVHLDFGEVPSVRCNPSQINQVFMNILSNASQAIQDQGQIWIKTWRQDSQALVSIRDSGPGIPPHVLEKIFDPFFTTKPVGQGTGLGLSISFGIVKKHGGDIQVRSRVGEGTEFILSLPIHGTSEVRA